jgi:hypothetical protein
MDNYHRISYETFFFCRNKTVDVICVHLYVIDSFFSSYVYSFSLLIINDGCKVKLNYYQVKNNVDEIGSSCLSHRPQKGLLEHRFARKYWQFFVKHDLKGVLKYEKGL